MNSSDSFNFPGISESLMENLVKLLKGRRSIRAFRGDSLSKDVVLEILDAARWAPSARNAQPVEYVIVTDISSRRQLAEAARQPQPVDAPISIVVVVDLLKSAKVGELSPKDASTIERAITLYAHLDAAAAIQNILLASTALGIGSLWISGFDESGVRQTINLPKAYKPIAIIVLGFPKRMVDPPVRRSFEDIISWETFQDRPKDDSYLRFGRSIDTQNNQ